MYVGMHHNTGTARTLGFRLWPLSGVLQQVLEAAQVDATLARREDERTVLCVMRQ
jgi:hypothetical protein